MVISEQHEYTLMFSISMNFEQAKLIYDTDFEAVATVLKEKHGELGEGKHDARGIGCWKCELPFEDTIVVPCKGEIRNKNNDLKDEAL